MKGLVVCLFALLITFYSTAYAVDPATKPDARTHQSEIQRDHSDGGPLPFPAQMIVGEVLGADTKPIGGVTVKLFADGKLVEIAHTTAAGEYEMRLPLSVEKDETVVLWFMPSTDDLLSQMVVVKKSSKARDARLFSRCLTEVRMRPQMRVDMSLLNKSEYISALKLKGCL